MDPQTITAVYSVSEFYLPYFHISVRSLPSTMPVVVSLVNGASPQDLPSNVQCVRGSMRQDNFSKAQTLNAALRQVTTPWVMIADADLVFPVKFFEYLDANCDAWQVRRFFVARCDPALTEGILAGRQSYERYRPYQGRRTWPRPSLPARGVRWVVNRLFPSLEVAYGRDVIDFSEIYGANNPCIMSRDLLLALRGYDERYVGWGGEDDDLTARGDRAGAVNVRVPLVVGHLHHPAVTDFPSYRSGSNRHDIVAASGVTAANSGVDPTGPREDVPSCP